jgi:ribosomal protein L40E
MSKGLPTEARAPGFLNASRSVMAPETCPNCGADVPVGARACPECGSDETTGWSEDAEYGGLDLPDEEFDYDKFVKQEFGKASPVPRGTHWFWWLAAAVLVILFITYMFR